MDCFIHVLVIYVQLVGGLEPWNFKLSIFGSSGRFSSPFRQGQFGEPPASRQVASSGDDILMVLKGVDNPLDPLVHHDFLDLTYMQYICTWIIMDYST